MKFERIPMVLCLAVVAWSVGGCMRTPTGTSTVEERTGRLTFAGSTTVQPLAAIIGDAYRVRHADTILEVAGGGSKVGIQAVHDGTADIGMASRELTEEESEGIEQTVIAVDVIAVVVNEKNPVASLTRAQLRGIYRGELLNWRDLGGADQAIIPVVRAETSGTRGAFDELVLNNGIPDAPKMVTVVTAGDVAAFVSENPGGIGYVGFGNIGDSLKTLAVDGVVPSPATAQNGSYGLVRPLLLLTGPLSHPTAKDFVKFALSDEGQRIIGENGWIRILGE